MTKTADLPAIVLISQSEWGLAWVFAHDLASHFVEEGHPVVYLNPFPKRFPRPREWRRFLGRLLDRPKLAGFGDHPRPPAVRFITPLTLPDSNRFFSWFNRRWLLPPLKKKVLAACAGRRCLVFAFLPFATPVAFAAMLDPQRLVYARRECYGDDLGLRHLDDREEELIGNADLVIASGPILAARSRVLLPYVLDIPGLVDFQTFFRPVGERRGPDPLCCFFGHVNERIDLPLLQRVGERYRLRIIGRISVDWPDEGNIERCGMVPHERVAELLAEADVVVIPYRLMGFTSSLFPYKIFEAFAQGKPVVVTRLPALEPLERLLFLASSGAEFLEMIARAAMEGPAIKRERQELARQHDRRTVLESLRLRLLGGEGGADVQRP